MDETDIQIKGEWRYLYRAADTQGQTIGFLLTEHRDTEAALRFLTQALRRTVCRSRSQSTAATPMKLPSSANKAHGTHILIREVKYVNNIFFGVGPGAGFFAAQIGCEAGFSTLIHIDVLPRV